MTSMVTQEQACACSCACACTHTHTRTYNWALYFGKARVLSTYCRHLCAGIVVVPRSWAREGEAQAPRWWPSTPDQNQRWSMLMTPLSRSKMGRWGRGELYITFFLTYEQFICLSHQRCLVILPGQVYNSCESSITQSNQLCDKSLYLL